MTDIRIPEKSAFIYALIAFLIAALSITGIILKTDLEGRVIWTLVWGFIGVAWLIGIVRSRKNKASEV